VSPLNWAKAEKDDNLSFSAFYLLKNNFVFKDLISLK
jgi:hypothetical protein